MILPSVKALYPDPIKSLVLSPIPTIQIIGLLGYYPLEHLVWFARKGIVRMDPKNVSRASIWSVRMWGYVALILCLCLRTDRRTSVAAFRCRRRD